MKAKQAKKPQSVKLAVMPNDETGQGLYGLAKELSGVAEELRPLYHIETVADNIGELASALHYLAQATALSAIAKNGTEEERKIALTSLKAGFEEFRD
jgi:hypothetical protein